MSLMHNEQSWFEGLRVSSHADRVVVGGTFVAIKGLQQNGADFIPQALMRGAKTIVVQSGEELSRQTVDAIVSAGANLLWVEDARRALGVLAAEAYGFPARKLKIIAVTGTKGKSTTSFLLEHILRTLGYTTALVSTVYNSINGCPLPPTGMTTPLPDYLHAFFAQCVEQGVDWVVCESAAQAFSMQRFVGIEFDAGIFTNFSQEHGEFYSTMDDYFAAKKQLLAHLKPNALLFLNQDDSAVARLSQEYKAARFFGRDLRFISPRLIGSFNEYNSTAAGYLVRGVLGRSIEDIVETLGCFEGVPGRLNQYVLPSGARVVIDYAHNPSSYEAVLGALRPLTSHMVVVFGCGGDRDRAKRPIMGHLASKFADQVIVTSDNPRSEDPSAIAQEILAGVKDPKKAVCLLDRKEAIEYAITQCAKPDSMIVLLGKGPEEYQLIKGVKHPFSEKRIVESFIPSINH